MPKKELNLLQLTTAIVTELRASSSQVVRRNMFESGSFTTAFDHVPDHILRDSFAPDRVGPAHGAKYPALRHACCGSPLIERRFHPVWDRDCADMSTLAVQIDHRPVVLPPLDLIHFQAD